MTPTSLNKWRYSLYTLFVVFLLFNRYTYQITNTISPIKTVNVQTPTIFGQCLHGLVFLVIIRYMMDLHL